MSDSSDRPFGHDTVEIHARFVPENAAQQTSSGNIATSVGYDAAKVSAVLVPPDASPPGYPFVRIGNARFRPDGNNASRHVYSSTLASGSSRHDTGPDQPDDLPPPPPVPALFRGQAVLSPAGLAAWRGLANPAAQPQALTRRPVSGTKRASPGASDPRSDEPQSD